LSGIKEGGSSLKTDYADLINSIFSFAHVNKTFYLYLTGIILLSVYFFHAITLSKILKK